MVKIKSMIENSLNEVALLEVACVRLSLEAAVSIVTHAGTNRTKTNRHTNGLFRVIDPRVRLIYPASKKMVSGRQEDFLQVPLSFCIKACMGLGAF